MKFLSKFPNCPLCSKIWRFQLLEVIGMISKSDGKKAWSHAVIYQDVVNLLNDDEAVAADDTTADSGDEDDILLAVGKVRGNCLDILNKLS